MTTRGEGDKLFRIQGLEVFGDATRPARRSRPRGTIREPARDTPVFAETDVLVVGGGPAGVAAAVGAARLGADVTLVERYNHLGGLSTGGLVIWIDRMTDWTGRHVIRGVAEELMDRLPRGAVFGPPKEAWGARDEATAAYWTQRTAAFHGVVTWSPTIDPEWLKTACMDMVLAHKVQLFLHAWAVAPIAEDGWIRGAIFESKEGRQAIRARVVVDASGDADLFARAGAALDSDIDERDIHHCTNTAWLFGGVDMDRWIAFRTGDPKGFSDFMARGRERLRFFEKPFVGWRNEVALFMGPRLSGYSAVDVDDLTTVEIQSRQLMIGHLEVYRAHAPGFEHAYLMLGAPQIGVRHTRRLRGLRRVTQAQWETARVWDDEIGVSPSLSPRVPNISVPYGSLVPDDLDGILGPGRHISCDPASHTFLREIPQCWMTGQAAGIAAALAAGGSTRLRDLDPRAIQRELLRQGAYLSPSVQAALRLPTAAI